MASHWECRGTSLTSKFCRYRAAGGEWTLGGRAPVSPVSNLERLHTDSGMTYSILEILSTSLDEAYPTPLLLHTRSYKSIDAQLKRISLCTTHTERIETTASHFPDCRRSTKGTIKAIDPSISISISIRRSRIEPHHPSTTQSCPSQATSTPPHHPPPSTTTQTSTKNQDGKSCAARSWKSP